MLLRKAPKRFSYALWAIALLRSLCPISLQSIFSLIPGNTQPIPLHLTDSYSAIPQIHTDIPIVNSAVNPLLEAGATTVVEPVGTTLLQFSLSVGWLLWLLGIAFLLLYSLGSYLRLRRRLIGALWLRENIYVVDYLTTPLFSAFGNPRSICPLR